MAYQETSRQSYGSKVKGSFQGILWGLVLIVAGTVILWWNEGRAVKANDALKDFQKNYVEMPDISTVNPEFEGKAVHATGIAMTADTLRDVEFGIAVNAFRLCRDVEYYQWEEHSSSQSKDKLGGATETTTTYTYEMQWCDAPVNSADFKDPDYQGKNFVWRVIENADQYAASATFGAYRLTEGIIGSISGEEPAQPVISEAETKQLLAKVADSTVVVTVRGNQVYIGSDPDSPHLGDVRITFNQVTSPKTISILQKVVNGTFESFIAKNGKSFSKVEMGTVSAENMIEHQKSANKFLLWLLRIIGALLVIGGNKSLLGFLSTVFAVVPFIQKIIGTGVGLVATLVGIVWSLIVIAIAWIAHRPVLAIALLVIAAAVTIWLLSRARKKKRSDVAVLLAVCLMAGLAGCTGNPVTTGGGDGEAVAPSVVKGPVQIVELTQYYGEGEPGTTIYHYDPAGNVVSEEEEYFEGYDEDYCMIEELCERDSEGRLTKEVYGTDGVADQITIHEYNDQGNVVLTESRRADGSWNYTTRNTYDDQGRLIATSNRSPYGESLLQYEFDGQGHQYKTTFYSNGALYSISENTYDEKENICYRRESYPQMGRVNEYYTSYDADDNIIGNRNYVNDESGYRLQYSDTTFTDKKGLRHQRSYTAYDDEAHTYEGIFNDKDYLTHYEFFKGTANNPSYVIDLDYDKDGTTLRKLVWKELSLGEVKETKTRDFSPRYDTFGNWIRRTSGIPYLFDGSYTTFDSLEEMLSESYRKITYRGDDQGQNYGFEGKAGKADLFLKCTEDDGVLFGSLTLDGNIWRAVGTRDKNNNLFFVAMDNEGNIPWSLSIPDGTGKLEATLFDSEGGSTPIALKTTRKGLETHKFAADPGDVVGLYEYNFKNGSTSGTLDVSRFGEDWEQVRFEIENIWYANVPKVAEDDQTDYFGNQTTNYYVYKWDDETSNSMSYSIRFYDGFAVIVIEKGSASDFFPPGTTIAGIYAKLPSVG